MNARQRNQLAMFKAVKKVFNTYNTQLNSIPAFATLILKFIDYIKDIEDLHQIQLGVTTGSSQLKQKEEKEMIDATVEMAAAIFVYAQFATKPDLMEKCRISHSLLEKLSAEELLATCLNLQSEAETLGDALVDYGKSTEDVSTLKKEINDFADLIGSPRSAIVTRSQARTQMGENIDAANDLLRFKADKLIGLLKTKEPKVYNTYKAARVIVDLRGGKKIEDEE